VHVTVEKTQPLFRDRADAGKRLAERLNQYHHSEVVVFAIPRGGVPVAIEVAEKLGSSLDIVIPRKIPIPFNPEAGYGAVSEEGVIVLNEPLVRQLRLSKRQIERQAEEVRAEVERRGAVYRSKLVVPSVEGKTAILIDDGLASGFTMIAAIRSMQQRKAAKTVVAVPVASRAAYDLVRPLADDMTCLVVARAYPFAVASFYRYWHDLTDEQVIEYLERWARRYSQAVKRNPDNSMSHHL
jgi:predicted phosphoribosyltransferase